MALSDIDRNLLERCLARKPRAWEDFVDRFTGLIIHVVNHTARCRSIMLSSADREDLTAEVFLAVVNDDFAVLRLAPWRLTVGLGAELAAGARPRVWSAPSCHQRP